MAPNSSEKPQWQKLRLTWFYEQMDRGKPFSFSRFGDAEIMILLGLLGRKNSNGCTFTPLIRNGLLEVLDDNLPYMQTLLLIAKRKLGPRFLQFAEKRGVHRQWMLGDVLLNQVLKGNLAEFVDRLREYKLLVVGQPFLSQLSSLGFFHFEHVVPPPQNAIEKRVEIVGRVSSYLDRVDCILWSSGLHAKVFINDIYKITDGQMTQIDCGSMWDGFCGQRSRSYIRRGKIDWPGLIEVNTGKRKKNKGETFRK